jgi:hypothetical protein
VVDWREYTVRCDGDMIANRDAVATIEYTARIDDRVATDENITHTADRLYFYKTVDH